ncbi:hypothetical protein PFISCL1PPCAC_2019 [Pristionchus fissidentatus]|uniref:Ubiquinone biosynthesis monooxygenase COQ6, mitochondrial n=1 Tax=Pristionchus fissidentatus TaxID=1538716 RepID=A0AAV5UWT0_9BILA|nr:hypothetical protein PFISCL1PPCAC_2019 [Pristionchus fissidentatus]
MLNVPLLARHASSSSARAGSSCDIVVVGGGLVGNTIAASIGLNSLLRDKKVVVVDSAKSKPTLRSNPSTYSNRVSAVSPASVQLFKDLGVWSRLEKYRVKRVNKLHVIESSSHAEITFDRPGSAEVAHIVENDAIVGVLADVLSTLPNVTHRIASKVQSCQLPETTSELASVTLEDGETLSAQLVIGADGANSMVRESTAICTTGWSYSQSAVVATLRVSADELNDTAWQRFSSHGPIALLPLSSDLSSLVWTTSPEEATRLCALNKDAFVDELNEALFTSSHQDQSVNQALFTVNSILSFLRSPIRPSSIPPHILSLETDNRASFPLGLSHSQSYVAPRVALLGDAAHRIHPLAGQGVNMGWRDVGILTQILEKTHKSGADIGSVSSLRQYDSVAQRYNVPTMVAIDWLNRLYSTQSTPIVLARSLGLSTFNSILPLKDLLVHSLSQQPKL